LNQETESYKHFKKHLDHCSICTDQFKLFLLKNEAMKVGIPKISMDRELKQTFNRELEEVFKVLKLSRGEQIKESVKNRFLFLDQMGLAFFKFEIQNLTRVLVFEFRTLLKFRPSHDM